MRACRPRDGKGARVGWIIGHFVSAPMASYIYYYDYHEGAAGPKASPFAQLTPVEFTEKLGSAQRDLEWPRTGASGA